MNNITDIHRMAFLLALFGDHKGFLSKDYLEEKLRLVFSIRNLDYLINALDADNQIKFDLYVESLEREL
jgi:hypothetical protein